MFLFITSSSVFCLYLHREPQGIIACCNPVPPLVRQYINELHLLVQEAREMPLLKVRKDEWQQGGCFGGVFSPLGIITSMFEMSLMIWGTRISQILQYLLHFTQAEIAAQKKTGLTPIKKVGLNPIDFGGWMTAGEMNVVLYHFPAWGPVVWSPWYIQGFWERSPSNFCWW